MWAVDTLWLVLKKHDGDLRERKEAAKPSISPSASPPAAGIMIHLKLWRALLLLTMLCQTGMSEKYGKMMMAWWSEVIFYSCWPGFSRRYIMFPTNDFSVISSGYFIRCDIAIMGCVGPKINNTSSVMSSGWMWITWQTGKRWETHGCMDKGIVLWGWIKVTFLWLNQILDKKKNWVVV